MPSENATHLLSVLHCKSADILQNEPAKATHEDVVESLWDRFRDHQLAADKRTQLKARVQASVETLQEFAAAEDHLAHRAFVELIVAFVQTEAANCFIDGLRDRDVRQHHLIGGDRISNVALLSRF